MGMFSPKSSPLHSPTSHPVLFFFMVCVCVLVTQSCPTFCDRMDCAAHQALLSMEFSRQEYWGGLPLPSPSSW